MNFLHRSSTRSAVAAAYLDHLLYKYSIIFKSSRIQIVCKHSLVCLKTFFRLRCDRKFVIARRVSKGQKHLYNKTVISFRTVKFPLELSHHNFDYLNFPRKNHGTCSISRKMNAHLKPVYMCINYQLRLKRSWSVTLAMRKCWRKICFQMGGASE